LDFRNGICFGFRVWYFGFIQAISERSFEGTTAPQTAFVEGDSAFNIDLHARLPSPHAPLPEGERSVSVAVLQDS
jgi:hypothetical protein